ncbi:MAG: 2Fe-2S iron-sulfur cluster-binding protein [Bacteroidota bacterium]
MAQFTFIYRDGAKTILQASSGSVMELATTNNIRGIDGDCGGVCSCATCHVHVPPDFMDKVGEANEIEADMLEFADEATAYSRLACQIQISEAMDGVHFEVVNS